MAKHNDREYFGVREISEVLEVSNSYLAKILQKLTRDGILKSITGPRGGFGLNQNINKLYLTRIIESMEDGESLTMCVLGWSECGDNNPCPFHDTWKKTRDDFQKTLKKTTVMEVSRLFWPELGK